MDEHLGNNSKQNNTTSVNDDDSMLDFKSPIQCSKIKLNSFLNSNVKNQKKNVAVKPKRTLKNHKDVKIKQQLKNRKNFQDLKPSIESSFFRPIGNSSNKVAANNVKVAIVCPLCFKTFKDLNSHTLHVKTCAYKNNIPTKTLLDAIELQKRQENERKSLGLLAAPVVEQKKKPVSSRAKLHEEWDLELALALSKSLHEAEELEEIEDNERLPNIMNKFEVGLTEPVCVGPLEKFGFANNKPPTLLKNKKRKNYQPTLLQTRTQEERNHILTERISAILIGDGPVTQNQIERNEYDSKLDEKKTALKSSLLQSLCNEERNLWNKAKLYCDQKYFYVPNLSVYIIPKEVEEQNGILEFTNACGIDNVNISKYMPAVHKNDEQHMLTCTELYFVDEGNDSYKSGHSIDTVIKNWANALNNSTASDIVIFVGNDKHIWAHKLVFYIQCSNILLDIMPNDTSSHSMIKEKICWMDIPHEIALAFLEFIYCGIIKKYVHVLKSLSTFPVLRKLARKYKVKELFAFLDKREKEVKQDDSKIYGHLNDYTFQKRDNLQLESITSDNLERLISLNSNISISDECKKSPEKDQIAKECILNELEITKIELKTDAVLQERLSPMRNMKPIEISSVSPDLFDDNDTIRNEVASKTKPIANDISIEDEKEYGNLVLSVLDKQEILIDEEKNNIHLSDSSSTTPLKTTKENVNDCTKSLQFSTPKRSGSIIKRTKNNISLFIEKFQRENEKSDMDTDSEVSALLAAPKLCRNPFNMKKYDISNDEYSAVDKNDVINESTKEDNILSMFDRTRNSKTYNSYVENATDLYAESPQSVEITAQSPEFGSPNKYTGMCGNDGTIVKKVNDTGTCEDTRRCSKFVFTNSFNGCTENPRSPLQSSGLKKMFSISHADDSVFTDSDTNDDEMSMYSKYKKEHVNNSIVNYRNFLHSGRILKSSESSNVICDVKRSNSHESTLSSMENGTETEFNMSPVQERDTPMHVTNEMSNCSSVNDKSSTSLQQNILGKQKGNNSSKLRYSKSESNLDLQQNLLRKNLVAPNSSPISVPLSPASPEFEWDVLNMYDCDKNKSKSNKFNASLCENNNAFLSNIHLSNVHIDNDDDKNSNSSSSVEEVIELNEEAVPIQTSGKKNGLSTPNNISIKVPANERNTFTKHSSRNVRKFQRKSVSETNLRANERQNNNTPKFYWINSNEVLCKCNHGKVVRAKASHDVGRESITPPPNYNGMLTPELHAELNKYGLKVQKRKRAVKLLTYIYNELHPTITMTTHNTEPEVAAISSDEDEPPEKRSNFSQLPLSPESATQTDVPESIIDQEKLFVDTEFTCVPNSTANIKDTFLKFLADNRELYNKILTYEPLCINSVHAMLKSKGFKCKMNTLMDFFDEQCITFYVQDKLK